MKRSLLTVFALSVVLCACSEETLSNLNSSDEPSQEDPNNDNPKTDDPKTDEPETPAKSDGSLGSICHDKVRCLDDLSCMQGFCRRYVDLGDACDEFNLCDESECVKSEGSAQGKCVRESSLHHTCNDTTIVCPAPLQCIALSANIHRCEDAVGLGEACQDGFTYCENGLLCHPQTNRCATRATIGETCDDTHTCEMPYSCVKGVCATRVNENCDASHVCISNTAVCYDGKCIESNECASESDCSADTYCCTEDACKVKNVCLPYGEGPRETTNDACEYETVPGLFEADIQCEWAKPAKDDPFPKQDSIVTPTFVAKTPHNTASGNTLIVATYQHGIWEPCDEAYQFGVIRFIDPEDCHVIENLYDKKNYVSAGATMAIADVDGDGFVEIFAQRSPHQASNGTTAGGIVAFGWDKEQNKYVTRWSQINGLKQKNYGWGGLSVHDLNGDNIPEVINPYGEVLNAQTGEKLNGTQVIDNAMFATIGDLDNDGKAEFIARSGKVYEWTITRDEAGAITSQTWVLEYDTTTTGYPLKAYADFGTPGATPEEFDWNTKDGIAEIVSTRGIDAGKGASQVAMHALTQTVNEDGTIKKGQQRILYIDKLYGGGAPTIGDFDNDGMPEVGIAFGDYYAVIDPRCKKDKDGNLPEGCSAENYLWRQKNQDDSSYTTGSSVFDFDADGQIEVVYADECYTRIYDGKTGDVLFSSKQSSRTAYEMPIIADIDNDDSAEILMGANLPERSCSELDAIHRGIRCHEDADCKSNVCENNFCRCESDAQCNWRKNENDVVISEYKCTTPLASDKEVNSKNVCRAYRKIGNPPTGLRVMRDRYDRWASSRNIWNQFAYSITNVNNDLSIPTLTDWVQNFLSPSFNNFRANSQGRLGRNVAPDITGKLNKDNLCKRTSSQDAKNAITLTGVVCNRGTKSVATAMPASFYEVLEDGSNGRKFCTAHTASNVPVGGCLEVSCTLDDIVPGTLVRMVSNDDGEGGRTTVECNSDNNTDEIILESCPVY